jgi:excisionase family DNA binding protein
MPRAKIRNGSLVQLRQASDELGIPYSTLYKLVRDGKLPHLDQNVFGRTYVVRRSDLEQFINDNFTTAVV